MSKKSKPIIIAEIGCNHKGDFKIAKQMIDTAARCGVDYVKFQKRNNDYLLGNNYNKPHPVPYNSYGNSYGAHRDFLEFSIKQHELLANYCLRKKIKYSTSVWDKYSALDMIQSKIRLDFLKIPSACNLDFELLETLFKKFKKKIHISTGMTTQNEIKKIFNFAKKFRRNKDVVFYCCSSNYPVEDHKDLCLLEINRMKKNYSKEIFDVGFSGHHIGIAPDIAAITLGANYVERHFTLNRTWKGTDHAASLEPQGLAKLVRDLNNVAAAMTFKPNRSVLLNEASQRKKLKIFRN